MPTPFAHKESQSSTQFTALPTLVIVLASNPHARQGLTSRHAALQVGRHYGGADDSHDDKAAGLDEEGGLLGAQGLFKEGDGGVVGGMIPSKVGGRRQSFLVGDTRVSIGSKEEADNE